MSLHRFDVISQSIMSGYNNMLYTIGIVPAYACNVCDALVVMKPLANVHETTWTPHVKPESDQRTEYFFGVT